MESKTYFLTAMNDETKHLHRRNLFRFDNGGLMVIRQICPKVIEYKLK